MAVVGLCVALLLAKRKYRLVASRHAEKRKPRSVGSDEAALNVTSGEDIHLVEGVRRASREGAERRAVGVIIR